jgi:hypothetical protein
MSKIATVVLSSRWWTVMLHRSYVALTAAAVAGCAEGAEQSADGDTSDSDADVQAAQAQNVNLYTNYRAQDRNWNLDTVVRIDDAGGTWGFFWAMNGSFENGDGWYIGLQENPEHGRQAIFSVWNARDAVCSTSGYRVDFGNEGSGVSCRRTLPWHEGTRYRLRVWQLDGEWWGGWLVNDDTGAEYFLGKIRAPSGAGALGPNVTDFTEYWCQRRPGGAGICARVGNSA